MELGSTPVDKTPDAICNAIEVFTSAVTVTFIEAGVSTKIKYKKGDIVTRSTAPNGATFVGWSTSSSGTSPVATFTANSNMAVYRVIKKNITYGSGNLTRRWDGYYDQTTNRNQISREIINGAQVSSISITCRSVSDNNTTPVPICIGTTLLGYMTGGTKSFTVPTNVNDYVYLGNNTGVYTMYYDDTSGYGKVFGRYTGRTVTSQYVG